ERPGSAPDSERAAGIAKPNRNGSRNASLERAVALRQLAAYGYAAAPWSLAAFGRTARPGLTAWGCRTRVRYPAGLSPTGQLIRTRSGCPAARRNLARLGRAAGPGRAGCWYPTEFGHPAGLGPTGQLMRAGSGDLAAPCYRAKDATVGRAASFRRAAALGQ